jgi:hypothetical protein
MVDSPAEVLAYAADLQDGKADQGGTVVFLSAVQRLADQAQQFLATIGR